MELLSYFKFNIYVYVFYVGILLDKKFFMRFKVKCLKLLILKIIRVIK